MSMVKEGEKNESGAGDTIVWRKDGKCPDGYTGVGPVCHKLSIIDKIPNPLENLKIPDFTSVPCEAALSALQGIANTMNDLMALPKKFMGMLNSLLNYPFSIAQNMLNTINGAIDAVSKAIDNLVKGVASASGLTDLMNAMNSILGCSFLADSDIGKLAGSIVDAIKSGMDVSGLLSPLKNALNSTVQSALNNVKGTASKSIANITNAMDNMIKQLGLDDIVKNMKKLEQCVNSLCSAFKSLESFTERLPNAVDNIMAAGGMAWDSVNQTVTNAASTLVNQASGGITGMASAAVGTVTGAVGSVTSTVTGAATALTGAASAVSTIASGNIASTITGAVTGTVSGAVSAVKNGASAVVTKAADAVTGGAASAISGAVSQVTSAGSQIAGAVSTAKDIISDPVSGITSAVSGTVVNNMTSTITGALSNTAASCSEGISTAIDNVKSVPTKIGDAISSAFGSSDSGSGGDSGSSGSSGSGGN